MLVLPFFLPASSGVAGTGADAEGAESEGVALLASTWADGLEGEPGGLDSGLFEARRFLGFEGGGGRVEKVVLVGAGWEGPWVSTGATGAATVAGEVVEADTFWRFCEGGDLSRLSVQGNFPL